ncbi:MAG: TIR domain-containing protein [Nitrosopumilaceae archaeon]|nr:TIR domain-containing protein [Nitrosopumilaceae archaeon]
MTSRHKVFVSFYHDDQQYKDRFVRMMDGHIVDESVHDEDIDDENLMTETIRRTIREDFIADATVTVVLVGECTWQRKHVDWEIGSSLRHTETNPRCGLLGILLPTHPNYHTDKYDENLVPPRLADNCGRDSYARMYKWSDSPSEVQEWIHDAFLRRDKIYPDNSRLQFKRNRSGDCSQGW